jgi:hypothetical protein
MANKRQGVTLMTFEQQSTGKFYIKDLYQNNRYWSVDTTNNNTVQLTYSGRDEFTVVPLGGKRFGLLYNNKYCRVGDDAVIRCNGDGLAEWETFEASINIPIWLMVTPAPTNDYYSFSTSLQGTRQVSTTTQHPFTTSRRPSTTPGSPSTTSRPPSTPPPSNYLSGTNPVTANSSSTKVLYIFTAATSGYTIFDRDTQQYWVVRSDNKVYGDYNSNNATQFRVRRESTNPRVITIAYNQKFCSIQQDGTLVCTSSAVGNSEKFNMSVAVDALTIRTS